MYAVNVHLGLSETEGN